MAMRVRLLPSKMPLDPLINLLGITMFVLNIFLDILGLEKDKLSQAKAKAS